MGDVLIQDTKIAEALNEYFLIHLQRGTFMTDYSVSGSLW